MASRRANITAATPSITQVGSQPTAHELLLLHLAGAHHRLREQETLKSQALSEKRSLQDKVDLLELELKKKDQSLAAANESSDRDTRALPIAPDAIADSTEGRGLESFQGRSVSASPVALSSRRPYVYLIIDGDANHFLPELLQAGGRGGEIAAERLKQEVSKFVAVRRYIPQSYTLKVQIFMNRQGFVDTMNQYDKIPKDHINACLNRFYQSQPTWDLVDTGGLRESADTKLKANFNLFVEDSDCFAMIVGVCSDNGYIQTLQQYQGNQEKMSKIALLTSYDTTVNFQRLTYAIVQWPTVFRSTRVSFGTTTFIAGPHTKRVTPLENSQHSADSAFETSQRTRFGAAANRRLQRKRQAHLKLPAPSALAPLEDCDKPVFCKPGSKEIQPQHLRKPSKAQQEPNAAASKRKGKRYKSATSNDKAGNPARLEQPVQSTNDTLDEPDNELLHPFESQSTFQMAAQGSIALGSIALAGGPFPLMRSLLPLNASVARKAANSISQSPPSVNKIPRVSLAACLTARRARTPPGHFGHPYVQPDPTKNRASENHHSSSQASTSAFGSASTKKPFIHVPIPNRTESTTYDPERYLYQQSPTYLRYNHSILNTLTTYVSNNYLNLPKDERPKTKVRLKIAEILVTRFFIALQIQALEDEAVEKGLRCSLPSDNGRGDAFTHDWEMYATLVRAVRGRVSRSMSEMAQQTFGSRFAKINYWNIVIGYE